LTRNLTSIFTSTLTRHNPLLKFWRVAIIAAFACALACAPYRVLAQSAGSSGSAPAASSQSGNTASSESPKSEEDQEKAFLQSPAVQTMARVMHLDVATASKIFIAINFAVIFFAIVIPLARIMPKMFRNRSQTLSQDLRTAREATADANSRLSAVEAKLAGLDAEMKKFRAQVEQDCIEDEKRIKASIGEESTRIVATAEQEIGAAAAQARRILRSYAAELAIDHAEKQLALTPETDRALISEFVSSVAGDSANKGGNN
jgi:F-type H+-transporting ATPase subunit b